jgi:hypothetical protein
MGTVTFVILASLAGVAGCSSAASTVTMPPEGHHLPSVLGPLQAVYDEDYEDYAHFFEEHASKDELIRLFDIPDISIRYFERQPDFYRACDGHFGVFADNRVR